MVNLEADELKKKTRMAIAVKYLVNVSHLLCFLKYLIKFKKNVTVGQIDKELCIFLTSLVTPASFSRASMSDFHPRRLINPLRRLTMLPGTR